jgi:hypothetical protein
MSLRKKHRSGNMEQGLSFIAVISICMIGIAINSPIWFLSAFVIGCTYLVIRGKKKGWSWKR